MFNNIYRFVIDYNRTKYLVLFGAEKYDANPANISTSDQRCFSVVDQR